jgi:hypothetical protein
LPAATVPAAAVSLVPAAEAEEAQEAEEAKEAEEAQEAVEGPVELGLSSTECGLDYYKSWLSS